MTTRSVGVALLVSFLIAGPTSAVQATFAGGDGRIAFDRRSSDFTTGKGIRTMRKDGTGVRRLTRRNDFGPVWSPDGTRIAFVRTSKEGVGRIMVMNADGSDLHRVGSPSRGFDDGCGIQPAKWSYDGLFITYADDCFDATPRVAQLRVAVADGSAEIEITDYSSLNHMSDQPWSPNLEESSEIVFTSDRDGDSEVYVTLSDGSEVRQLTNDEVDQFAPVWSPVGDLIAFNTQTVEGEDAFNSLYTIAPTGGEATEIVTGDPHATEPQWSPDGTHLLFARRDFFGAPTASVVGPDGSDEITLGEGIEPATTVWSPTGRAVAYERNGNIFRIRLSDLSVKKLTTGPPVDLNPDWQSKRAM